ncbi:MAG: HD domain-containing protein [Arcobacteraceae bacterium]|nr:HD domain-containing protein [Arcobacteraceae bacterium]
MAAKSFKEVEKSRNIIYVKNKKNEILSFIKEMVGYGGLIHNFKNYVIRGEEKYAADVKKQYVQLIDNIHQYKMFENITLEEIDKLNIIKEVFTQYIEGVQKVKIAYQTGTDIHVLDKIVKVDDKPAIKALHDLTTNIYGSQSLWFKQSTLRINSLKEIENKIADDLDIFINNQTNTLSIGLIAQVIIVVAILVIIFFSVAMLRELIESEKRLNRAQESTKSGSYEYHIEKNVIIWSDEHYKLLQVDKETFKPTIDSFMKFVHPDDVQIVKKNMDMAISSKKIVFFEYRLILTDNTEIFTKSSAEVTKYDKKGDPLIIVGTITDITQSKELEQEIIDTQKDVVFTMGAIGETRSRETGHHVKRVAEYSKLLYLLSGANEDDAELLKMASPMHDIGKVGIPDHILNKPGKLTSEEWTIMQTHSEMGYEMLKNSNREILKLAATVALTHHEKYDGSGYPKGLIAQEIPLVGRITALADVFDALGSHRCYKTAWELEKILNMLKEERAKHFDPHLIDLFIGNLDKFLEIRNSYKDII